ncbi:MAG: hypothetical protein ACJ8C4_15395 [Gemmataceae bacterium]
MAQRLPFVAFALAIFFTVCPCSSAGTLKVSVGQTVRIASEVEADYTTTHVMIDELRHDSIPVTLFFDPQILHVESAEIFTNLNRRDRCMTDADGDGVEDGIKPPPGNLIKVGDDHHYYKSRAMSLVAGGYQLTLQIEKCGVYRLTARYRLIGDPAGQYRWYGDDSNASGVRKRDHILVVSPSRIRDLRIYEVNPLTMLATGPAPEQRGTFADLASGLANDQDPRFSLNYVKNLGCNAIWLQPIHPRGIDGRQIDTETGQPFVLGSPYAVKNFFEVMPLMAKGVAPADGDTPTGRSHALKQFQQFVKASNQAGVYIILDAPFNHAARDVELAEAGKKYWGQTSTSATSELRKVEARVFSRAAHYDMRAGSASNAAVAPATAPDRYDFGKWTDVLDFYFGRYAALVADAGETGNYKDEEDWFDYSIGGEEQRGEGNGHFDKITQDVWRYFADYVQYWLSQTGYPANPNGEALDMNSGVSGLRSDFAQGLPPQCLEYIVNRTRTRCWNFLFMAESLDGGAVTYRSSRQFDVLNENTIYELHTCQTHRDYKRLYNSRRNAYALAVILLNTSSQDEDNYQNPYEAFLRHAANNTIDGATMIFPGQELGLRGTIVPPNGSSSTVGPPYGYQRYEKGFGTIPKPIPLFKDYNSLMPLWRDLKQGTGEASHLQNLYAMVGQARASSAALRSPNRIFLELTNRAPHETIYAVAKFDRRNSDATSRDVVFAFVNLSVSEDSATPTGIGFNVAIDADGDGANDFGIKPERFYNVKNLAAYTAANANRRDEWLWTQPRKGDDLLGNGIFVSMNRVPVTPNVWTMRPYEPQFLKLYEVPAPH